MLGAKLTTAEYLARLKDEIDRVDQAAMRTWAALTYQAWERGKFVFVIGNGGSGTTATHISDLRTLSLRERVMRNDRQRQSLTIPLDNAPLVDAKVGTALLAALRDASGPGWQEVVRRIPLAGMFLEADATSPVPSTSSNKR